MVECNITHAYSSETSFLSQNICVHMMPYFIFRYLGDLFALTVHVLLNVAIIIATRETSLGRGNIGRQLVFGAIGIFVMSGVLGAIHREVGVRCHLDHQIMIGVFCVSMVICAVIALCAR